MMDLKDALRTIRSECKKHSSCEYCPLRTDFDECYLRKDQFPAYWEFTFDEEPTKDRLII